MTPESRGIFVQSGKSRSENILKVHVECTKAVDIKHSFLEDEFHTGEKDRSSFNIEKKSNILIRFSYLHTVLAWYGILIWSNHAYDLCFERLGKKSGKNRNIGSQGKVGNFARGKKVGIFCWAHLRRTLMRIAYNRYFLEWVVVSCLFLSKQYLTMNKAVRSVRFLVLVAMFTASAAVL